METKRQMDHGELTIALKDDTVTWTYVDHDTGRRYQDCSLKIIGADFNHIYSNWCKQPLSLLSINDTKVMIKRLDADYPITRQLVRINPDHGIEKAETKRQIGKCDFIITLENDTVTLTYVDDDTGRRYQDCSETLAQPQNCVFVKDMANTIYSKWCNQESTVLSINDNVVRIRRSQSDYAILQRVQSQKAITRHYNQLTLTIVLDDDTLTLSCFDFISNCQYK